MSTPEAIFNALETSLSQIYSVNIKNYLGTPCAFDSIQDFNQSYQPTKPTMKLITHVATLALTAVVATSVLKAGEATGKDVKAPVVAAPASPMFNLNVSENYDSRYMFRGVNIVPNTGILSTTFNPIWHISANDTLSVPIWYATAVGKTFPNGLQNYRELDVPVNYTHAIGNWTLGASYLLYTYYNVPGLHPGGQGVQNEVGVNVGYTYKTGIVTWTPALYYYYELGTPNGYSYGCIHPGSSFLSPQLTASVPLNFLKADGSITFNPNAQYNFTFGYNYNQNAQYVTGANNFQITLPVTWQITKIVSLTGYAAYSYQGLGLYGTAPSTVWGGASVGFSF